MKNVIETLKFVNGLQSMPYYEVRETSVKFVLHAPPECESLFGDEKTARIQIKLSDFGFRLIRRIDCRERTEDRYETIIYHYLYDFSPTPEGDEFLKDWEANPYFKCDVLIKYGIVPG